MKYFLLSFLFLIGCTNLPVTQGPSGERIALSWENTDAAHPERAEWSDALTKIVQDNFSTFDSATDISMFCPKYKSLSQDLKTKAWGELFVGLAYYESGYNPKSSSVDVGTAGNKETYSDGLFQMSGVDGASKHFGYKHVDLLDPIKNIEVGTYQMILQIKGRGKVVLKNGDSMRYWATLLDGNKYDKTDSIIGRVKKNAPSCN